MSYWVPFLLSALCINGVHLYLLISQKAKRKSTISEHAVLHKKTYLLYVLGHLLGGAFFLLFAKEYYLDGLGLSGLFMLVVVTVVFEYAQALLPARGKTNNIHTITALMMWLSFLTFGALNIIFVPATMLQKASATIVYAVLFMFLSHATKNREKLYKYQMIMVLLFYFAVAILIL